MTIYQADLTMAFVGEAMCAGASDPTSVKAYLERKYPRKRRYSPAQVQRAMRDIRQLAPDIERGFWQDCEDMRRCDNDWHGQGEEAQGR